jgi:hydrogenase maturation factor
MNHRNELLLGSWVLVHQGDLLQIQTLDESLVHCGFNFLLKL